jgi:hypothetical protein
MVQPPYSSVHGEQSEIHQEKSSHEKTSYFTKQEHYLLVKNKFSANKQENSDLFFSPIVPKVVRNIQDVRVSGFKFCSILDNSLFNVWVHICIFYVLTQVALNGSIAQVNPKVTDFVRMIDSAATEYFSQFSQYPADKESIKRFSCYMAVSGRSEYISISEEPSDFLVF